MAKVAAKTQKKKRKRKQRTEPEPGEQLNLIDVAPENAKEILPVARRYKKALAQRLQAEKEEVAAKQELRELVNRAGLQRLEDGKIKFGCGDFIITITPRDELVQVKDKKDTSEDSEAA